jgi:hypothetical protein
VRGSLVKAVVVVPLERGAFGPAVLAEVVDVGFPSPGLEQQIVAGGLRRQPRGDAAEAGERVTLGEAAGLAVELGAIVPAVQVDAELAGPGWQLVAESDRGSLAGGAANRRPGKGAAVGPEPRLRAGQDLCLGLADRDLDMGVGQLRRDRQRRAKGLGTERARGLLAEGEQGLELAPPRRQQGRGTGAQDAEKASAPQARRR